MPKQIPLTKGKTAIVDDDDYEKISKYLWHFLNSGYAAGRVGDKKSKVLMHRFIMNAPSGLEVDHINGNKLDNRKENLRICTRQQNEVNKGVSKNNTSGQRGVTYDKRKKKWRAQTYYFKKNITIGRFENFEDAVNAYKEKARQLFGDFLKP